MNQRKKNVTKYKKNSLENYSSPTIIVFYIWLQYRWDLGVYSGNNYVTINILKCHVEEVTTWQLWSQSYHVSRSGSLRFYPWNWSGNDCLKPYWRAKSSFGVLLCLLSKTCMVAFAMADWWRPFTGWGPVGTMYIPSANTRFLLWDLLLIKYQFWESNNFFVKINLKIRYFALGNNISHVIKEASFGRCFALGH